MKSGKKSLKVATANSKYSIVPVLREAVAPGQPSELWYALYSKGETIPIGFFREIPAAQKAIAHLKQRVAGE